jgi:hypothetical protein
MLADVAYEKHEQEGGREGENEEKNDTDDECSDHADLRVCRPTERDIGIGAKDNGGRTFRGGCSQLDGLDTESSVKDSIDSGESRAVGDCAPSVPRSPER